ncbi:MAG: fasciclin domain-containing protein [Bacteroidota bacterium]|nr:fasciclin domain-containing protein [Bacteroidota bacterium]
MEINKIDLHKFIKSYLFIAIMIIAASCNKQLPDATPIIYSPINNSTTSIGSLLSNDTTYSFFKAAATKSGMLAQLNDSTNVFTVFLPNNAAFRVSGIPSLAVVNSLPPTVLGGIVGYAIIPGKQYTSADIPATFPNIQLPTSLTIGTLPGTSLSLKLSTFPSVRANGFWDNNIPVLMPDMKMQNGVVHLVAAIVAPPSQLLRSALYSNPNLTYFKAAIARADSGQTGLNRIDSLLGYAVTNMTVLAPVDSAFQKLLFGSIYGALLAQGLPQAQAFGAAQALSSTPDVFSDSALFSVLTATKVRGIVVYHFLATDMGSGFQPNIRAFSVNFSPTPTFYTTLVNSAFAAHPGINGQATFTGPFVTSLQFTGLGTFPPGGAPYSDAPAKAISLDNHAVNGVYHVIDKVLLPQ